MAAAYLSPQYLCCPLTLAQLGGVPALVKLLTSDDREVLRNTCLALTCCAKHPEALPQMYGPPLRT
jgi:hypothetical protein